LFCVSSIIEQLNLLNKPEARAVANVQQKPDPPPKTRNPKLSTGKTLDNPYQSPMPKSLATLSPTVNTAKQNQTKKQRNPKISAIAAAMAQDSCTIPLNCKLHI
jgi:hypothetical protein